MSVAAESIIKAGRSQAWGVKGRRGRQGRQFLFALLISLVRLVLFLYFTTQQKLRAC